MNFQIVSDSSCDFSLEMAKENGIDLVPFYVSFDEVNYKKEHVECDIREFYQQMVDEKGVYPKSSMPSVQDFADAFLPHVIKGEPVICICITTKFSGSYQSATTARDMVLEDYKDAKITVIDSQINTVLQGLFVHEAIKLRDQGAGYEDAVSRLLEIRASGRIFFTVGSIDYLQHGGRIGKVAGAAVSVLGIRPMITLKEGEIFSSGLAKGRKKSLDKIVKLLKEYLDETGKNISDYSICVGYGYDIEEGKQFAEKVKAEMLDGYGTIENLTICQIGATIAVHTGPYPIGVGIIEKA